MQDKFNQFNVTKNNPQNITLCILALNGNSPKQDRIITIIKPNYMHAMHRWCELLLQM